MVPAAASEAISDGTSEGDGAALVVAGVDSDAESSLLEQAPRKSSAATLATAAVLSFMVFS